MSHSQNVLLSEYEVALGRCERDQLVLLRRLADEGLVEFRT